MTIDALNLVPQKLGPKVLPCIIIIMPLADMGVQTKHGLNVVPLQ